MQQTKFYIYFSILLFLSCAKPAHKKKWNSITYNPEIKTKFIELSQTEKLKNSDCLLTMGWKEDSMIFTKGVPFQRWIDSTTNYTAFPFLNSFVNDTIFCGGGMGYYSAFGFHLKITVNSFKSNLFFSGPKYRFIEDSIYTNEIFPAAIKESLTLHKEVNKYEAGDTIYGLLTGEYQPIISEHPSDTQSWFWKCYFTTILEDSDFFRKELFFDE